MIKGPIDGKSQKMTVKIQLWKWGSHLELQKIHRCLHQVWNTVWTGRAAEAFLSLTWSRETEEAELRREEHRQAGSAGGAPPHWQQERGASWHVRPERLLTSPCSPLQAPGKVQQRASPGISSVFGIKRNARREDKASIKKKKKKWKSSKTYQWMKDTRQKDAAPTRQNRKQAWSNCLSESSERNHKDAGNQGEDDEVTSVDEMRAKLMESREKIAKKKVP